MNAPKGGCLVWLWALVLSVIPVTAQTCKVVSVSGSGAKTGADWSNAYQGLPATLVRGTVYYLADGSYGQATISSASGSGWVELRKAQTYDHCTDTGWNASTMGNSQAVFSRGNGGQAFAIWLQIDQFILNGNGTYSPAGCGGGPSSATDVTSGPVNPKDCGIKVVNLCTNTSTNGCDDMIVQTNSATNWKFIYNEWQGLGNAQYEQYPTNTNVANNNSATRLYQHIYGHDFGANILVGQGHREVDHCYWWGNQRIQYPSNHGQYSYDGFLSPIVGISEHHSVYRDIQGTAIWGIEDGPQVASNINIYDNIIMSTSPQLPWVNIGVNNGSLWCGNGSTCSNVNYVNNTHVNLVGQSPGPFYQDAGTSTSNVSVRNNIWYNSIGASWQTNMSGTQDHNSWLNSGSGICKTGTGNVCTQASGNPFTNIANLDFTLASDGENWNNRIALGSPYDTDALGNAFTSSRGAYQFNGSQGQTQNAAASATLITTSTVTINRIATNLRAQSEALTTTGLVTASRLVTNSRGCSENLAVLDALNASAINSGHVFVSHCGAALEGPPLYLGSEQGVPPLRTIQQPPTPNVGNLTGAGTIVTPTGWNNPIVRMTDVNTSSLSFISKSYDLTDSGGGKDMQWNVDDTMLSIINSGTAHGTVLVFNPATMQVSNPYPSLSIPTGRAWSKTNPKLMRTLDSTGSGTAVKLYDFTPTPPAVTITTEFDYRSCPGLSGITAIWSAPISTTGGDALVATAFSTTGNQDTGILVAAYRPSDGACQVWDTNACTLTGSGGLPSGTVSPCYPFAVHDIAAGPGPWAQVGVGGTSCPTCPTPHGPFFWEVGTANVTLSLANSGGHNAMGFQHWWNITNAPAMCGRLFSDPATCSPINSRTGINPMAPQDTHCGSPNMTAADTAPLFCSQASTPNPAFYGAAYTSPIQNEIYGVFPTTGAYIRVAPTFTSGLDDAVQESFRSEYAVPAISQTGRFIAFASDWFDPTTGTGTLGNRDGVTSACTLGGWPWNATRQYTLNYQIAPNLTNVSTGYSVASGLPTTGGNGIGATVNVTTVGAGGKITAVTLGSGGTGYQKSDTLAIVQGAGVNGYAYVDTMTGGVIQTIKLGPAHYTFKATACSGGVCSQGATEPVWPLAIGSTVQDGAITWTEQPPPDCRWDIFVTRVR